MVDQNPKIETRLIGSARKKRGTSILNATSQKIRIIVLLIRRENNKKILVKPTL